ncbi:MAG TPA: 16S rRNA (uracil(1498)-N(3))-methyltransferase [Candidatus Melainabacteria bacterium]|nr:16S rRNA (uracil(1498)-N(3))-methyltransferase [Candidatus Melainabacteria bacterium]HIN63433.1 16S rRNA (uracil(1498)-N(3))-methyltransferase [Candidatus Obscuribacterales bacterium]
MQIPRFFIQPDQIDENVSAARIEDAKLVHQIGRVLRLGVGARVILLNGEGSLFHCRIERQDKGSVHLAIEQKETNPIREYGELTVAMPLIKPARFEWSLEKLTELGATTIIPIITQRTVQKPSDGEDGKKKDAKNGNVKKERWNAIVREAAEQSERFAIPRVVAPQKFDDYLNEIVRARETENSTKDLRYIFAERNECPHLSMHLFKEKEIGGLTKNISLCFGPEGGFTDAELSRAAEVSLTFASLGKLILRSETAAVAAAAIVSAMRDLKNIG